MMLLVFFLRQLLKPDSLNRLVEVCVFYEPI